MKSQQKVRRVTGGFFQLKGDVFPYDVLVCLGVTPQEVLDYVKLRFENPLDKESTDAMKDADGKHGKAIKTEEGWHILWLAKYPETAQQFGFLAHEIFHTADLMLRRMGASLSDDSDEVWAYHIDWLTKKIYEAFSLPSRSIRSKKIIK